MTEFDDDFCREMFDICSRQPCYSKLEVAMDLIEAHHPATLEHGIETAEQCISIANIINLDPEIYQDLFVGSLLHDIGKIYVPLHILDKKENNLTDEEWAEMRKHPVLGARLLEHLGFPYRVHRMVFEHHLHQTPNPYPAGAIPDPEVANCVGMLTLGDMIDSLTRPYKGHLTPGEKKELILSRFCAVLPDKFLYIPGINSYIDLEAKKLN